jgi:hypothetical protein
LNNPENKTAQTNFFLHKTNRHIQNKRELPLFSGDGAGCGILKNNKRHDCPAF